MTARECYDGGTCRNADLVAELEAEVIRLTPLARQAEFNAARVRFLEHQVDELAGRLGFYQVGPRGQEV